ncbi:hypothetical protein Psi01_27550 [Planobispora siamensis]|uniref:Uncharacterized protein n=1 Tax=Planobispora siamensis TaxID=936338 RepID=A0A8J3SGL8_9ACTN|nr:hypothetical protein Psi01_27550 [Planobispora siamensis]
MDVEAERPFPEAFERALGELARGGRGVAVGKCGWHGIQSAVPGTVPDTAMQHIAAGPLTGRSHRPTIRENLKESFL